MPNLDSNPEKNWISSRITDGFMTWNLDSTNDCNCNSNLDLTDFETCFEYFLWVAVFLVGTDKLTDWGDGGEGRHLLILLELFSVEILFSYFFLGGLIGRRGGRVDLQRDSSVWPRINFLIAEVTMFSFPTWFSVVRSSSSFSKRLLTLTQYGWWSA